MNRELTDWTGPHGLPRFDLISDDDFAPAMQAALAAAPLVTLYKQYVIRFGLGYTEEVRNDVQIVGHTEPVRMRYAEPTGPLGY